MKLKTVSSVMALIIIISVFAPVSASAKTVGGVETKLNEVMEEFPPVTSQGDPDSVYFTVSGNPSTSISSSDCYYPDVARAHGYDWDNMWSAYSCCGFVHFVFRYIFGVEFTWENSVTQTTLTIDNEKEDEEIIDDLDAFFKKCTIGDAILFNRPSTHYVIFLGYNASTQRVLTYDCGWDQECAVKTLNRSLNGMKSYKSIVRYHANNYDQINGVVVEEPEFEYNVISNFTKAIEITGCTLDMKSITIPSTVDGYTVIRIAEEAFKGTSLESIKLPETLTSIGKCAFENTVLYKNSTYGNEVIIENCLIRVTENTETYKVDDKITLIADGTFDSSYINTVIIPESTFYISPDAFENSAVENIVGTEESAAEEFAEENGFTFININDIHLTGDINNDGKVTLVDAKWVLQSVAKTRTLTSEQYGYADVNSDGKVTIVDAKWLLQTIAGTRKLTCINAESFTESTPDIADDFS